MSYIVPVTIRRRRGEERDAAEHLRARSIVQADEPMRRDPGGDAGGQHGTGRGAGHEVERLTRRPPGLPLQLREQDGRDDPADAAAVDREDASHGHECRSAIVTAARSRIRGARAGSGPRRRAHPLLARPGPAARSSTAPIAATSMTTSTKRDGRGRGPSRRHRRGPRSRPPRRRPKAVPSVNISWSARRAECPPRPARRVSRTSRASIE